MRSQPALERVATWQVPNAVIQSIVGRLPPGGLATGNTNLEILDADHRLYADNRRTQIDMRFAKIFRFGQRRLDVGVDLGNLLNTNYTTTYENTYQYQRRQYGDGRHLEQPDGNLHSAVRPLEPDGRLLRCSVASARRRHLCSARTSRSRKSTAILVMKFAADYPGASAPQCVGIVSSRFQHARERDIETGQKMAEAARNLVPGSHTLHLVRGFCGAARGRSTYHLPRGAGTLVPAEAQLVQAAPSHRSVVHERHQAMVNGCGGGVSGDVARGCHGAVG